MRTDELNAAYALLDNKYIKLQEELIISKKKLEESEERFKEYQALGQIGSWEYSPESGKIKLSAEAYRITGCKPTSNALPFQDYLATIHPEDLPAFQDKFKSILETATTFELELRHKLPDNTWNYGLTRVMAIQEYGGNIRIIGTVTDITERRQTEEDLSQRVELFVGIFNSLPDAIILIDPHNATISWPIVDCNEAVCKMNGYTREELVNHSVDALNATKGTPEERAVYLENVRQCGTLHIETFHRHKDGHIFPIEVSTSIINLGGREMVLGIDRDITERKLTEKALRESEERYRSLVEVSPDAIAVHTGGKFVYVNPSAIKLIHAQNESELIGKPILDIVHPDYTELTLQRIKEAIEYGKAQSLEEEKIVCLDGTIIDVEMVSVPTIFKGEKAVQLVARNITERKQAEVELVIAKERAVDSEHHLLTKNEEYEAINEELIKTNQELIKAKEKAQESDRLKTIFLQNMSHEIRTPMNAIMGFSELLTSNFDKKDKLQTFSSIIRQRSSDLLQLINEILDLSKIETGQLPVNTEECNLSELFAELHEFFINHREIINKPNIELQFTVDCEPQLLIILTDKGKLKQIFINLIYNALKFTSEGMVKFGCTCGVNNNLTFFVSDTGTGIPEDKQALIFQRFMQLDSIGSSVLGGTGLGLAIVKGLIELLGGEIKLESAVGVGSSFYFSIPYQRAVRTKPNQLKNLPGTSSNWQEYTLLIVEDDPFNAEYLKEVLSLTKINILIAYTALQAIEFVESGKTIDIILMDIRLGGMDGYELTGLIKKKKPQIKVIAQTAYATDIDQQNAIDAGCDDYISKPINREALITKIIKLLIQ